MAKATLHRRVMHAPNDLFDLVSDVERYPEFINLLSAIRVSNREQVSGSIERFEAEANVSYKFLSERFNSLVEVDRENLTIDVSKADRSGAVRALKNNWVFHPLSDGSTYVDFFVEVKLKAFPLEMMMREKFDKAGRHIMNLFETKAGQTYKKIGDADLDLDTELSRLGLSQVEA